MKGILLKEPLFNQTINGNKTNTRRLLSPKLIFNDEPSRYKFHIYDQEEGGAHFEDLNPEITPWITPFFGRYKECDIVYLKEPYFIGKGAIYYKFDYEKGSEIRENIKWKNKLFMAARYARYYIEITKVTCQRLKDITRSDIRAEGLVCPKKFCSDDLEYNYKNWYVHEWERLWNEINGKKYTWDYNPWVFVYSYELLRSNFSDFLSK